MARVPGEPWCRSPRRRSRCRYVRSPLRPSSRARFGHGCGRRHVSYSHAGRRTARGRLLLRHRVRRRADRQPSRSRRGDDAARVKDAIAAALRRGERVVVFPEGTTTDGTRVGQFYPALLQAAIDAGAPLQPVAIRYVGIDGKPDPATAFIDDMSFAESLARILARPRIVAEVHVAPPYTASHATRGELAFATRRWITAALLLEDGPQPEPRRCERLRR